MRYYFNLVRGCESILDKVGIEVAEVPAQIFDAIVLQALAQSRMEEREVADLGTGWMLEICDASNVVQLLIDLDGFDRLTSRAFGLGTFDQPAIFQDLGGNLHQD